MTSKILATLVLILSSSPALALLKVNHSACTEAEIGYTKSDGKFLCRDAAEFCTASDSLSEEKTAPCDSPAQIARACGGSSRLIVLARDKEGDRRYRCRGDSAPAPLSGEALIDSNNEMPNYQAGCCF